jgi:2-dehydro-3-deoxygluconokinase
MPKAILSSKPMAKILNFGELLLRISPDAEGAWLQHNTLPCYIGGAEANVAAALALWGLPSAYMSAIPDHDLSKQLVGFLNGLNIDTSAMQYSGDRIGLYYLTQGKDLKNAGVIYDRAHSAYAELKTGSIDWDTVFKDVDWFHFSAICPAISAGVAAVCEEALQVASARGVRISLDLNYRAKLWKYGNTPKEVMPALAKYCDLIMGNIWAANNMLGIAVDKGISPESDQYAYLKASEASSQTIIKQYPKCTAVANTFRFDYKQGVNYYTTLYTKGQLLVSKEYLSDRIVGRIGSGDCFMAGLIYGFYTGLEPQETLNFATAAAFSKLFTKSDFTTTKIEDIPSIVKPYEQ